MPYTVGDLVRVSTEFKVSGAATDPTTVTLKWRGPTGTVTAWVYLTDSQVVKTSVGNFRADIDATLAGTYQFRWIGTGAAQGSSQSSFTVEAAML